MADDRKEWASVIKESKAVRRTQSRTESELRLKIVIKAVYNKV